MTDKKSEEIETESSLEWAEVDEMEVCSSEDGSELVVPKPQLYSEEEKVTESKRRWKKGGRREGGGGGGGVTTTQDGGCLVCGLDNDYQNVCCVCVCGGGGGWVDGCVCVCVGVGVGGRVGMWVGVCSSKGKEIHIHSYTHM